MQVVDFTRLMLVCHHVTTSMLTSSSCIKSVKIRLDEIGSEKPLWGEFNKLLYCIVL